MSLTIISGGQTGADRTALEVAEEYGIPTGGWCPLGCRTDEGLAPELVTRFGLKETKDLGYRNRTRLNVQEASGTVLFGNVQSPGCTLTIVTCVHHRRPFLVNPTARELAAWIQREGINTLNVAGNRRRSQPEIVEQVRTVLRETFTLLRRDHWIW